MNENGRVQIKDLQNKSYMYLGLYKRISLRSKKLRIIDIFDTK